MGMPTRSQGAARHFLPRGLVALQKRGELGTPRSQPGNVLSRGPARHTAEAAGGRASPCLVASAQRQQPDPALCPQKPAWDGRSILPSPQHFSFFLKKKKMFSK